VPAEFNEMRDLAAADGYRVVNHDTRDDGSLIYLSHGARPSSSTFKSEGVGGYSHPEEEESDRR